MNRKTLLLLVLSMALLALVIGCGSKEDTTANVGDVADKAKEVGGETVDTVVAVGFDAVKTEYIAVAKTTVDEWNTKIVDCTSCSEFECGCFRLRVRKKRDWANPPESGPIQLQPAIAAFIRSWKSAV